MAKIGIKCTANGPNLIVVDGEVKIALCRCGSSNDKPYCDGSHKNAGFIAEDKDLVVLDS